MRLACICPWDNEYNMPNIAMQQHIEVGISNPFLTQGNLASNSF